MRTAALLSTLVLLACGPRRPASVPTTTPTGFVTTAAGARLAYWILGAGRDTALVVHGFQGQGSGYLRADLAPLAGRERTLILYDQRGDAWSSSAGDASELTAFGLDARVADLEAVRRHFGLERLTVLAHSGGAAIAVRYAEQQPARVARLLLIAPLPPAREPFGTAAGRAFASRLDRAAVAQAMMHQASLATAADPRAACRAIATVVLPAYFADRSAVGRMRGDFCGGPAEALRAQPARLAAFQRSLPTEWTASAARIRTPVLVMHGDHDAVPVAAARNWVAALPNARLLVIGRADHLPWVEQPRQVFAAAAEFVAGRWPAGASASP